MEKAVKEFCKDLEQWNVSLSERQIQQFMQYYEMLIQKNKVMNLTAITELTDVMKKHFLDSISIVQMMDLKQTESVIDVGTGASFPGIPLKIVFPHLKIVLLDSLNKRVKFLNDVCDALKLENISCIHGRAEDIGRKEEYREQFDLCVSRAVANLSTLSEYCLPFVKVGGYFTPYKAGNVEEEVENAKEAVKKLSGKIEESDEFVLPGTDINRVILQIKKIKPISKVYPRKAGLPGKEPL